MFPIYLIIATILIIKCCEYISNWNLHTINWESSCFEYESRAYNLTNAAIKVSRDRLKSMERHTDIFGCSEEV